MTTDADQLIIAGTGTVYVAATGATIPDDATGTPDAAFLTLGYLTDDGAQFTYSRSMADVRAWQGRGPIRRYVTDEMAAISFTLLEWDHKTVPFAFGGATVTSLGGGEYKIEPPDISVIDERALILDLDDGTTNHRFIIPRGMAAPEISTGFTKSGPSLLPVTFGALYNEGVAPWTHFSDSAAYDATEAGS